jgi:thioredoxin-related protein
MLKQILIVFFLLFSWFTNSAATIQGKNQEYAGKQLRFFQYANPVTQKIKPAFTLEIDNKGHFSTDVNVSQTTFVFAEFDIYRGLLFLEPDKTLNLLLPPLREKSFADSKNPYFQPVEFWFATQNGKQLNDVVSKFDSKLNELTDRYFNQLYFRQSKAAFDSLQHALENEFGEVTNSAFTWHKKLKLKAVEADAFRLEPHEISQVFQNLDLKVINHPAFIQLFEKTFAGKLSFEARAVDGNAVREAVVSRNISFLKNFPEENYNVKGLPGDLALLKMLHDAFYSGDFAQDDILSMVGSPVFRKHSENAIREISRNILEKLEFLKKGSQAPVICLKNTDGHRVCTNESQEEEKKFKYLVFADTEMIVCREHLKYLTRTEEQFQKYLEIIVVLRKTDLIEMKMFLDRENIPGIHLVDENGEFIEKYKVKSFPTCFLLNENHEVVFQQAKAPLDGFEQQFGTFLRQELFERQRNQSQ